MAAVARAVFGYLFLVFLMRIVGRRPGKQLTPVEFVLIFFSGGLTLTFMVADDRSLVNALSQILAVSLTHFAIVALKSNSDRFGLLIDGTPLVLLRRGEWQVETMTKMRMQAEDVMATARDKGLERLDQIEYAILERNGEISIIQTEEASTGRDPVPPDERGTSADLGAGRESVVRANSSRESQRA